MPNAVAFDRSRITDPALQPIAEKVAAGERLTAADGVTLFRTPDLLGLGTLADAANRAKHGDLVTFASNQHINPTNVCILRQTCVFCSYARLPKEDGAYRYTMDQVWAEAASANGALTREFHIVGGLDMKAGLAYYSEMFRGLKARHPQVHIKALTAVEIAHIARIEKMSVRDVLIALREAGLDTMPGGGAEVFSPGVRATIADREARRQRMDRRPPRRARARHPHQLHDALRPRRDGRGPHQPSRHAARPAGRDGRIPRLHPARVSPRQQRARRGARTHGHGDDRHRRPEEPRRRPALPRQLRAHQVALDHGDAGALAALAALRRERSRGHRRAREDLSRGRRAHGAGDEPRPICCGSSAAPARCPPSAIRSTTSSAPSTTTRREPRRDDARRTDPVHQLLSGVRRHRSRRRHARCGAGGRHPVRAEPAHGARSARHQRHLRRRVRARRRALSAAPRSRDLVRRAGAERDALLARAGREPLGGAACS